MGLTASNAQLVGKKIGAIRAILRVKSAARCNAQAVLFLAIRAQE